jgi:hypothetical protein
MEPTLVDIASAIVYLEKTKMFKELNYKEQFEYILIAKEYSEKGILHLKKEKQKND